MLLKMVPFDRPLVGHKYSSVLYHQVSIYAWAYWAQARGPMAFGGPLALIMHFLRVELSKLIKINV